MNPVTIGITRPSSREKNSPLSQRLAELSQQGFAIKIREAAASPDWPYTAGSAEDRAHALSSLLLDPEVDIILAARGGYGASDLLHLLPWDELQKASQKILVGFSDTTALQMALWNKLQWPSIHGPMPGSSCRIRIGGPPPATCTSWVASRPPASGPVKEKISRAVQSLISYVPVLICGRG